MRHTVLASQLERHLRDTCRITRDPEGADDDHLDDTSGRLTRRPGEPEIVYDADSLGADDRPLLGRCAVYPAATHPGLLTEGGQAVVTNRYAALLPYDAPAPLPGDDLHVLASGDAWLVGRVFRVTEVEGATDAAARRLVLEGRTDA